MRIRLKNDVSARLRRAMALFILPIATGLWLFGGPGFVFAQPPDQDATIASAENDLAAKATIITLKTIVQSAKDINDELRDVKKELKAAETQEEKIKVSNAINRLNERIEALEGNFERIATGVDLEAFYARPQKDFDWTEEIQDLLGPILQELKSMTARPRQIEKLRGELAYYEQRIPIVRKAVINIEKLIEQTEDKKLRGQLNDLKKTWVNKEQQIASQLTVARYQLEEKSKERKSLVESTENILRIFFRSRGRNLFFSLMAFIIVFLLLRLAHQLIYKFSPIHKSRDRSFYIRLGDVIYHILTFVGATSALLLVLYASGDWVLLSLFIIFMFGLAWTARMGLSRFWEQIKLLLNLGTVRENERVFYRGLPWRVVVLNLYSQLENPEFKSRRIRLPLRDLVGLHSRPYHPDEPWFPCKENDWVILADGTHGKVVMQTPEIVRLVLRGGSRKTYLTEEFLKMNPNNISTNFRLNVTFGIDYRHQAVCTQEVPDKLKQTIREELAEAGYGDDLINLSVEFKEAGASSLDLEILADFSGKLAQYHDVLARALQRIAVDTCNKYGWVIPFTQITLHTAEAPSKEKG